MSSTERWVPVPGFEGRYEVSSEGRLRALFERRTGRLLPNGRMHHPASDYDGYQLVHLQRVSGGHRQAKVHRIVLEAFVGPCPPGQQCRHRNGNPGDNRLENLCWGTVKENHRDKLRHGTTPRGERNVKAVLKADDVRQIRSLLARGANTGALADRFGVSRSTISHIRNGHTWAWLDREHDAEVAA